MSMSAVSEVWETSEVRFGRTLFLSMVLFYRVRGGVNVLRDLWCSGLRSLLG